MRLQIVPFWRLTNKGWLPEYFGKVMHWGDARRCNKTIIVPFIGEIIWWESYKQMVEKAVVIHSSECDLDDGYVEMIAKAILTPDVSYFDPHSLDALWADRPTREHARHQARCVLAALREEQDS